MGSGRGEVGEAAKRPAAPRYGSAALIAYGTIGVAVHLRLLSLLGAGVAAWLGLPDPSAAPPAWGLLGPLQAHYDAVPWLPWAAWLVGMGLLSRPLLAPAAEEGREQKAEGSKPQSRPAFCLLLSANWLLPSALCLLLLGLGGYARMVELWPQAAGLSQFPYDDEGVYAGASQLFTQGILPYRDYFFAHPPVAAISYAPAMAYHFTQWGSPTSFMIARYLSVAYSLVTLALIFLIGRQLAGPVGGVISGALWALDGRVVEINRKVMLDGPMVLLSCAALLVYLWVRPALVGTVGAPLVGAWLADPNVGGTPAGRPRGSPLQERGAVARRPMLALLVVGALGALSALTKIAGAACLLAILADLLWMRLDRVPSAEYRVPSGSGQIPGTRYSLLVTVGSLLGGALAAALVCVGPFLIIAPSAFARQVLFFQMLRPSDGVIAVPARIADLSATFANPLTLIFASVGVVAITYYVLRIGWGGYAIGNTQYTARLLSWRPVALWTFFSLLLFTYSRSFYSHYYIQLAAPLCLLGAGVAYLIQSPRRFAPVQSPKSKVQSHRGSDFGLWTLDFGLWIAIVLAIAVLPLVAVQWREVNTRHEDRIFEIVGRYVNDAVPPGTPVLTTDEQFNFLAARPPSHGATGYLVDSYGLMIYLGLGLGTRDWGDLVSASLRGEHGNDAYAVMQRPAPQADIVARALGVSLVVLHQKGLARLTPATVSAIEARSQVADRQARYTIYRVRPNTGGSRQ